MTMLRSRKIIIITAILTALVIAAIVVLRSFVFDLLIVKGHSMSPTIRHKDRILVNRLAYRFGEPEIGDIIAFRAEDGRVFVKRVVGLPGDFIEVKKGLLYRNSEEVKHEAYVEFHPLSPGRRSYRPRIVQAEHLFVMGDNRVLSVDSKDFGPITYRDVIGKAILIYFPPGRVSKLD